MSVVIVLWTVSSLLACFGAACLAALAYRDWRIVSADHGDMRRRAIRRETSGILIRSGIIRSLTTGIFVVVGIAGAQKTEPVSMLAGLVSIGLAVLTLAMTLRDLVARYRIAKLT